MIIIKKTLLYYLSFVFLFTISFLSVFIIGEPRIKLGEHYIYCNPKAKINPKKIYHLRLWDYNWPIKHYRTDMIQVIHDFQKIYPNVHVDLKLLDLIKGPDQLEIALKTNNPPDVYCSAYMIPDFNLKKQIPAGPYLRKNEQELYFPAIKNMATCHGVLCYFPRFIAPRFWIGNQELIESAGLSVAKIQDAGWTWQDLSQLRKYVKKDKYILVGNMGENGLFTQLIDSANGESQRVNHGKIEVMNATIDLIETLINQKAIPVDCDYNMLGRFLSGQAMLLAGVRPAMYDFINKRLKNDSAEWQAVLLPVPSRFTGVRNMAVENCVISVYRNKLTAGDDHLVAAMKFAQFLSCHQILPSWKSLMVSPATKFAYAKWAPNFMHNQILYNKLINSPLINASILPSPCRDKLYSVLNDFVAQKINGEEVKAKLGNR